MRVLIKPQVLEWACERSGQGPEALAARFPRLPEWIRGDAQPSLKQLEAFARATHTPVGYFFLPEPPVERVPIPDFRTMAGGAMAEPSPELLDTVYLCQQRQEWYHDHAQSLGEAPREFVGAANVRMATEDAAAKIRRALDLDSDERRRMPTWEAALRRLIEQADELGVLVMVNGVVGSNNHRKLDPEEFRGFALADPLAPLVFINGADTKSAQMFTLAHELAHIWLGETALSDVEMTHAPSHATERWCNAVAAEVLVPLQALRAAYDRRADLLEEARRLARVFKVSTLVVLRRVFDARYIGRDEFNEAYRTELQRLLSIRRGDGGGNFYWTQAARVGKRFARAIVASALEGQTLHRDAFRLLGFSKLSTFRELGHSLGVA
jgi:Zn-dependent peptidase ImmA (M78 family)